MSASFPDHNLDSVMDFAATTMSASYPDHNIDSVMDFEATTMTAPASTMSATGPTIESRLLKLAAELRNRIYEYALTEDRDIHVGHRGFHQSGLLQTNRQIRSETRAMYFSVNTFAIDAKNFDPTWIIKFSSATRINSGNVRPKSFKFNFGFGTPVWDNVMEWLRACFEGRTTLSFGSDGTSNAAVTVVAQAFELLRELMKAKNSWETIEASMEVLYRATEKLVYWQ